MTKYIDFHTHAFADKIAKRAMENLTDSSDTKPVTDGTVTGLISVLNKCKIQKAVLHSIATKATQQRVINDWSIEVQENNAEIYCFGSIHPDNPDRFTELEYIKQSGLYGLKLHPDYQGFEVFDERMTEVYDICSQINLPVLIHAGFDPVSPNRLWSRPADFVKLMKEFPNLILIAAHMGGVKQYEECVTELAGTKGNIYLDTAIISQYVPLEYVQKMIDLHGADRVLFASDCPWDDPMNEIELIDRLNLSDSGKELIYCGNAERLLGEK
ncbi:MAG: amidohydrolase family protein [Ruminococcus sp.]|jgi:predicted TIM-barrel fold metal-dependent hydrolase|nr:amidohydrolase family protein [Ruminococcus sp.]